MDTENATQGKPEKQKFSDMFKNLRWYEILAAGWPLILVVFGGAIGGACGGLAFYLNLKLFNSQLSKGLKYLFSFLVGIGGILLYILFVIILALFFPQLFK